MIAPSNAANQTQIDSATKRAKDRLNRDSDDLAFVLGDPRGRRFLGVLIFEMAGVKRLSLTESVTATAANEGARNLGLQLLAKIEAQDFHASLMMQAERFDEVQRDSIVATEAKEKAPPTGMATMYAGMPLGDSD